MKDLDQLARETDEALLQIDWTSKTRQQRIAIIRSALEQARLIGVEDADTNSDFAKGIREAKHGQQPREPWTVKRVLAILGGNIATGEIKRLVHEINATLPPRQECQLSPSGKHNYMGKPRMCFHCGHTLYDAPQQGSPAPTGKHWVEITEDEKNKIGGWRLMVDGKAIYLRPAASIGAEWECPECHTRYIRDVGKCGDLQGCSQPRVIPIGSKDTREGVWNASIGAPTEDTKLLHRLRKILEHIKNGRWRDAQAKCCEGIAAIDAAMSPDSAKATSDKQEGK